MKRFFSTITTICILCACSLSSFAAMTGDWKIYPSFDYSLERVLETPDRVYFCGYSKYYTKTSQTHADPLMSLFCYDKKGDEVMALSRRNYLSSDQILSMNYNPQKKYLMVVYDDLNIDFFHDDGHVTNVAALMNATLPGAKRINDVTFHPESDAVYIATEFGYVCIDDERCEVRESRNYGERLLSVARVGDFIVISSPDRGLVAKVTEPRFTLDDYTVDNWIKAAVSFYACPDGKLLFIGGGKGYQSALYASDINPNTRRIENVKAQVRGVLVDFYPVDNGYIYRTHTTISKVGDDLQVVSLDVPEELQKTPVASRDFKTFWFGYPRLGLRSYSYDGTQWTLTRDYMRPNTPAANISYDMLYHPKYGMIVPSHGVEGRFKFDYVFHSLINISALRRGEWKEYAPLYTRPQRAGYADNFWGCAVDPDNDKYIYRGSIFDGIMRLNLEDPWDVLHMSRTNSDTKHYDGFVGMVEPFESYRILCRFFKPQFDSKGNLFSIYNNLEAELDGKRQARLELYRWSPENRKASTDAAHFKPWDHFFIGNYPATNTDLFGVCRTASNENKIVIWNAEADHKRLIIYDHKGTFDTTADDLLVPIESAFDQDGGSISLDNVNWIYEDPQTSLIWLGTNEGVCNFNLRQQLTNPGTFNRVKVARNDGTSLADYLLNEVQVNHIMDDGQGRKWFSTGGGGVVCTTSDGKRILGEVTAENSYLPANLVYSTAYNPENQSIFISTDRGLAEFYPAGGTPSDSAKPEVRAYPNPVEPDYYGYVTIDGLPDNCLVKIVDSAGGLVCELGMAENGSIQWDVTGLDHKRVNTGTYFIMISGGSSSDSTSAVGKILVMN